MSVALEKIAARSKAAHVCVCVCEWVCVWARVSVIRLYFGPQCTVDLLSFAEGRADNVLSAVLTAVCGT